MNSNSRWVLLSHPLDESTPAYAGRTDAFILDQKRNAECDGSSLFRITMDNHHGTHIDLPAHFCPSGKTVGSYSIEQWIFESPYLLEAPADQLSKRFDQIPKKTDLLLWKTGFQSTRHTDTYWKEQPIIAPELGSALRSKFPHLRAIGLDLLSLSSLRNRQIGREAHREFLCKNDILIIEDMNLAPLKHSPHQVIVAPLFIPKLDGTPCTVIAHV